MKKLVIEAVVEAKPDVFNHNIETVPRLYPKYAPVPVISLAYLF